MAADDNISALYAEGMPGRRNRNLSTRRRRQYLDQDWPRAASAAPCRSRATVSAWRGNATRHVSYSSAGISLTPPRLTTAASEAICRHIRAHHVRPTSRAQCGAFIGGTPTRSERAMRGDEQYYSRQPSWAPHTRINESERWQHAHCSRCGRRRHYSAPKAAAIPTHR